jgi:hypothetical protein
MVDRTKADRIRRIAGVTSGGTVTEIQVNSDGSIVGTVGLSVSEVSATFARPNNNTAYTAKDVVSDSTSTPTVLTFTNIARVNGGSGNIVKGRIFIDSATAMLGATFRLHLYHTAPTAIADNSPFALLYANRDKRIGFIDFPATTTEGTGSDSSASLWVDLPLAFKCASDSRNLYGILELTATGAVPTANHNIWVALMAENN